MVLSLRSRSFGAPIGVASVALALLASPTLSHAQSRTTSALSLADAVAQARGASPDLRAAREAVAAARARERQASAFQNPLLTYSREQTSGAGQSNSQNIATLEQPLELGGQRGARRNAARLRREAAEARLAIAEAQLDFDVTRAYAQALAADRRAALADQATGAFAVALRVSRQRLAAGDVSGYANRRLRLEAARYGTVRAEATLASRTARVTLASLVAGSPDALGPTDVVLADSLFADSLPAAFVELAPDSLRAVALRGRGELRAAALEAAASTAEARLASRERMPVPVLSAGVKTEQVAGVPKGMSGLVAGVSIPLPLWDRRAGTVGAAEAEARRRTAEAGAVRRRVTREVAEAYDAYRAVASQLETLRAELGPEAATALRAAQVAYAEGEIPLVEWLDAVRAYQEAEAAYATLRADALIRRAALERALGAPLSTVTTDGARGRPGPED
ncbi:MAG: TolC family protein [Gemmatimonadaceae bacterium]